MKLSKTHFILMVAFFITTSAWAEKKIRVTITFTPSGSFHAVSDKLKGNLVKRDGVLQSERLWVNADTFRTEVNLRDEHFSMHLKNSDIIMTDIKGQNGRGEGTIEINGVKKTVAMKFQDKNGHVEVTFRLDASEFNLPQAAFLGIGVTNEVDVWAIAPYTVYVEKATKPSIAAPSGAQP